MVKTAVTMEEAKKLSCATCEHHVDKGQDENYCKIACWKCYEMLPHMRKPGWCPILKRAKRVDWERRMENESND